MKVRSLGWEDTLEESMETHSSIRSLGWEDTLEESMETHSSIRSLGWEGTLEESMETHSSILAWTMPWTEEPGGLQSIGLQRVGHD